MPARKPPCAAIPPEGLPRPRANWFRMPNLIVLIIASLARERSYAEIIVLVYIIRHTWGYSEFDRPKHITLDEFEHGRMHADSDRTRIDNGTGLTRSAIQRALHRLAQRGILDVITDDHNPSYIRKSYRIRIKS
jgi:hypothetical protein